MIYKGLLTIVAIEREESKNGKLKIRKSPYPKEIGIGIKMYSKVDYQPDMWRAIVQEGVDISEVISNLKELIKANAIAKVAYWNNFISEVESLSE